MFEVAVSPHVARGDTGYSEHQNWFQSAGSSGAGPASYPAKRLPRSRMEAKLTASCC